MCLSDLYQFNNLNTPIRHLLSPLGLFALLLSVPLPRARVWVCACVWVCVLTWLCGRSRARAGSLLGPHWSLCRGLDWSPPRSGWELRCAWDHLAFGSDLLVPPVGVYGHGITTCAGPGLCRSTCTLRGSTPALAGMQGSLVCLPLEGFRGPEAGLALHLAPRLDVHIHPPRTGPC